MVSPWSMADGLMLDPSAALLGLPRPLADRRRAPQPPGSTANRTGAATVRAQFAETAPHTHISVTMSPNHIRMHTKMCGVGFRRTTRIQEHGGARTTSTPAHAAPGA